MLNTVAKRITSYQLHSYGSMSPCSSARASEAGHGDFADGTHNSGGSVRRSLSRRASATAHAVAVMHSGTPETVTSPSHAERTTASPLGDEAGAPTFDMNPHGGSPRAERGALMTTLGRQASGGDLASDARTAQFASLAELRDLRGLEAAIGAAAASGDLQV